MEKQQIVEKLIEFRNIHEAAIEACSKIIEEVIPWTPREYGFSDSITGSLPMRHSDLGSIKHQRPGVEGYLVEAGQSLGITFGIVHTIPDTELFGVPETAQIRFGIDHPFRIKHLVIDDETAKHFDVQHLFIGNRVCWSTSQVVPADRFAESLLPWPS